MLLGVQLEVLSLDMVVSDTVVTTIARGSQRRMLGHQGCNWNRLLKVMTVMIGFFGT